MAYFVDIQKYLSESNTNFQDENLIYVVQKVKKYMREVQVHHAARYNPYLDFEIDKVQLTELYKNNATALAQNSSIEPLFDFVFKETCKIRNAIYI
jgi:hypothetical protein